ncbi:MAG: hypothetical protein ACLPH3_03730 [Terracidiphilus sp.]
MRRIIPSLIWFSALAGGPPYDAKATAAANVPTDSCAVLPATEAGGAGGTVVYLNREYGFSFSLPPSWKGFRVLACRWSGANAARHGQEETGPLLVIRHPLYTEENPREDIPIMIFTRKQWGKDGTNLIVSAAGVGPSELGRNREYVFALPPRFAYVDVEGVQEVLDIVTGRPLRAVQISHDTKP